MSGENQEKVLRWMIIGNSDTLPSFIMAVSV